ncbi:hypothetical protein AB0T83_15685 [Fluviibacterium sp. DFM31]|uniref:DUF192 domain-containing protein n=1 Tax=Meridianimarinicoccus marinus TaxID=3231483 RepID=A0ABV3L9V0_9RHOB
MTEKTCEGLVKMWKWLKRGILAVLVIFIGYEVYVYFKAGYHRVPERPIGSFLLPFGEVRAIMIDVEDVRPERRYFAYPAMDLPEWYQGAWSVCRPVTDPERQEFEADLDPGPGVRWEAVCEFEADGETVFAGIVFSVPRT